MRTHLYCHVEGVCFCAADLRFATLVYRTSIFRVGERVLVAETAMGAGTWCALEVIIVI